MYIKALLFRLTKSPYIIGSLQEHCSFCEGASVRGYSNALVLSREWGMDPYNTPFSSPCSGRYNPFPHPLLRATESKGLMFRFGLLVRASGGG